MAKTQAKIYVGTSGWIYGSWKGVFYPEKLSSRDKLKYYSSHFKTTEINYSFYHLPKSSTYQNWYSQTPPDFIFSVKVSRFITHIKRIKGVKKAWRIFIDNAVGLKEKLGPILFQFPPSFKATPENIKRLDEFLKFISENSFSNSSKFARYAFEFRDKTFCAQKIYDLLKKYNAAWVIADSSKYPKAEVVSADFVYVRMHGPAAIFGSKYQKKQIKELAGKIKKWLLQGLDIFVYFNNDAYGYAVENAKELISFIR